MISIYKIKIKKWFEEAVRIDTKFDPNLRETLLRGHPNLDGFFDRLADSFKIGNDKLIKHGKRLTDKTMQEATYDMTYMFMKGMENEAKLRYESDLAKSARDAEDQKIKEFESVLEGKPVGEFAEAGVITNEKIDSEREESFEQEANIGQNKI